jgi:DUF4097 and DUF4098 domain-containing protein YvlB
MIFALQLLLRIAMSSRLKPVIIAIALIGFAMSTTRGIANEYSSVIEQERRVERGSRIVIRNPFGDIRIAGSERDTVAAIATDLNGSRPVPVTISEGSSGNQRVFTVSPVEGGRSARQQINLEIKVPRDVELEAIGIRKGNIRVMDLNGGVRLRTDEGNITVSRVESPAGGLVEVAVPNGTVDLSNIKGDVRVVAISSNITVQCVKGHVAARVSSGHIKILNILGDVDAGASSGVVSFTGAIYPGRRYRLRTISGNVDMQIPDTVGFTALLTSYSGQLHTDFQFPRARSKQQMIGKYGDGTARIELDSFNGSVQLGKIPLGSVPDCQK